MKVAIIFTHSTGVRGTVDATSVAMVKEALPDAEVYLVESEQELIERGIQADIIICWTTLGGHFLCENYCLNYNKNLKWMHSLSAGVEAVTFSDVGKLHGLRLTSSSGIHGYPISEHVMGCILCFMRKFPELLRNQSQSLWERPYPDEVAGKTIGIIGIGKIGKMIAKRAKAFGMRVVGVKRTPALVEFVDEIFLEDQLDVVLAKCDFVVLATPQTPDTLKMMNSQRFSVMKPSAYFINVGRGACIDQESLIAALQSGIIAGAALDVCTPEPLPAESPLWQMENVIITPHISAETPLYMERAFRVFQENAAAYLAGEKMPTEVDLSNSY